MADILVIGRGQHYGEPLPSRQSLIAWHNVGSVVPDLASFFSTGIQKIVFQFKKMNSFISTLLVYMRELSKCSECVRMKSRKLKCP